MNTGNFEFENHSKVVAYQESLLRDYNRSRLFSLRLPTIVILLMLILISVIWTGSSWGVPEEPSAYLLDVPFWRFDEKEFRKTLLHHSEGMTYFPILLLIYWVYFLLPFVFFIVTAWALSRYKKATRPRHCQGIISSLILLRRLSSVIATPSVSSKLHLSLALRHATRISHAASPMKYEWYKEPAQQWLGFEDISKQARAITLSLFRFQKDFPKIIRTPALLCQFKSVVESLRSYFLLVAAAADDKLQGLLDSREIQKPQDILSTFSRDMRSLSIGLASYEKERSKAGKLSRWVQQVIASSVIQNAAVLSAVASVVMILGVFVFKIDAKLAFLTWFTVAFGSLTVSIGISSMKMVHDQPSRKEQNKE